MIGSFADFSIEEKATVEAAMRTAGSSDVAEAVSGHEHLAAAIDVPLNEILLNGGVANGIFFSDVLGENVAAEYPLDIIKPGDETQYLAYNIPDTGSIPERLTFGDYITLKTFRVGNSQHWPLKILRTARFPILKRFMELYETGWVQKNSDDAFAVLLGAAKDRDLMVYDAQAAQGQFSTRLITLLQNKMRRAGGGNTATPNRFKLTHLVMSPESLGQMRTMTVAELPEAIRNQVAMSDKGYINSLWGVTFMDIEEFGVGAKYQELFLNKLGGALTDDAAPDHDHDDVELVLGLDLSNRDSTFINPVVSPVKTYPEGEAYFRRDLGGVYGKGQWGWAVLDNRRTILGSF